MPLKPGDTFNVSRDGKVFLTQYQTVGAHVSLTRTLGDDPPADVAEMNALADRLWHEGMLANFRLVNGAYTAVGVGENVDVEKLVSYLESKTRNDAQETPAAPALRKRKLSGK